MAGTSLFEAVRVNNYLQVLKLNDSLLDVAQVQEIQQCLDKNVRAHTHNLVPRLQSKIQNLYVGTCKKAHVEAYRRHLDKEKHDFQHRLSSQTLKLEDVKAQEEAKTQEVYAERKRTRTQLATDAQYLLELKQQVRLSELKYSRQAETLENRTRVLGLDLQKLLAKHGQIQQTLLTQRNQLTSELDTLNDVLAQEKARERRTACVLEADKALLAELRKRLRSRAAQEVSRSGCGPQVVQHRLG